MFVFAPFNLECLDGLEEFSHIWLYFKFHLNTNTLKEAKAFSGAVNDNRKYTFSGVQIIQECLQTYFHNDFNVKKYK